MSTGGAGFERQLEEQQALLRRALQESEALRRVGRVLASTRDLTPALRLVTQTAAELVRAEAAVVIIRSGTELELASVWGRVAPTPGIKSANLLAVLSDGWRETAAAALREEEQELGLLWAARARAEPFSGRELEVLEALADVTALAISNVRAHERLRRVAARGDTAPLTPAPSESAVHEPVDPRLLVVPPFPAVLGRLLALTDSDQSSAAAVGETVGLDPVLAGRAIQLAGSPALGRVRAVTTLNEAILVLGVKGIRNLAFAQFTRGMVLRHGIVDELLWEQSLGAAVTAQLLVERREPRLADDAYLCGLLCNIGAVALNNVHPHRYDAALRHAITGGISLADAEREEFGSDAAALTDAVVSGWKLPARVGTALQSLRQRPSKGALDIALRWAPFAALRMSPLWDKVLGGRGEPDWLQQTLARAEGQLGVTGEILDQARNAASSRFWTLRGLVA